MSDLEQLRQKLAGTSAENGFLLDSRTVNDVLTSVADYNRHLPFAGHTDASWAPFWMTDNDPDGLSNIYHDPERAAKKLPVQQAFLLALLELLETPKALLNTLPARHRSLYYRALLGFAPRGNRPDSVAVSFTLQKNVASYHLPGGTLLDAGQDSSGNHLTYRTDDSLLITGQELRQLCWTRKDADGVWQFCTALDLDQSIALPDEGVRLFTETDHETPWSVKTRLDTPLLKLRGEKTVSATWPLNEADSGVMPEIVWQMGDQHQVLCAGRPAPHQRVYPVPDSGAAQVSAPLAAEKGGSLALRFPAGQRAARPDTLSIAIANCREIRYQAPGGHGHLEAFSYPFGLSPRSGQAFTLTLPASLVQTGGELTIEPQWISLPQENFARWYANYLAPPAGNSVFEVQLYLTTPAARRPLGGKQPLFYGDGAPQCAPLHATLPADSTLASDAEVTLSVVLSGPDFLHGQWQQDPAGKNAPWTPQVSRINSHFQQRLTLPDVVTPMAEPADRPTLYLGLRGVAAQETVSVYWALRASTALTLSWQYYNQQNQWVSLDAVVEDDTAGLSVSNLWRAVLPKDIQAGGEGLSPACYWIKAVPSASDTITTDSAPRLQKIVANAMTATLNEEAKIADSHFAQPLPANTIGQLVSPVAAINQISQPLPSTGGRMRETEAALLQRARSRIAHRQRAITWGNMRSLLMEEFSQIFDVRFPDVEKLNHIPALNEQPLMVIPDSRYSDNDDALRPVLSAGRLASMTRWLVQYTSPWAKPTLINPLYVDVTARYQVIFATGIHPDYGYRQLEAQLRQEYMPWVDDRKRVVTPGNQVDYYALLATLQQSPLVERVVRLTLSRSDGGETQQTITARDDEVLILRVKTPALTGEAHV